MSQKNPYYSPEELDLEILVFDREGLCYEYDTLCFWRTKQGLVYSASNSGCSCPTPFKDYEGETLADVLLTLERVQDLDHAIRIYNSWKPDESACVEKLIEWWEKTR